MRHRYLLLLQVAFLSIMVVYGCTIYQKPRPYYDVPFQERSQSETDGDVRVIISEHYRLANDIHKTSNFILLLPIYNNVAV